MFIDCCQELCRFSKQWLFSRAEQLARFSFQLSRSYVQFKSCWLLSSVRAMLAFAVVYRWDSRVGLLVALLCWKLAWHLHAMKVSLGAATTLSLCTFRSVPAQGVFWPVSKVHCVFSNSDLSSSSRGNQGQKQQAVCFGESPEQPWSISQRELLMSGVGFLLGGLWLICQSRKVHKNYICVCMYVCIDIYTL